MSQDVTPEKSIWASRSLRIEVCVMAGLPVCGAVEVFVLGSDLWESWALMPLGVVVICLRILQAHLSARSQKVWRERHSSPEGALPVSEQLAQIDQMLAAGEISQAEHAAATAQILGNAPLEQR
jgi:hypothetical protein